ncbi:polysaccharide deacetylase family protein [Sphingomonas sp.]|uniref:polysaccharide deacetylase family protein n=1 Tax=Sphingomonas sp. TaxID=28214 RepID=UPI00286A473B|nr:polysaccharide deacetylase family protein [Sphingomonas sp.]
MLLVSIHDVTPRYESEIDGLLDRLRPHVGDCLAMLVVPNHWGDCPIVSGSPFATRLRDWSDRGIEMFLHGWSHRDSTAHAGAVDRLRARHLTAGEGEFLGLSRAQASALIGDGKALVEGIIGRPITGFIAPAWLYGPGTRQAMMDCNVELAEDHWRVWSPTRGAELVRSPVITWASRSRWRKMSSLALAGAMRHVPLPPVMRIGVHPPDVRVPALLRSIDVTITQLAKTRRRGGYAELLKALPNQS